MSASGY